MSTVSSVGGKNESILVRIPPSPRQSCPFIYAHMLSQVEGRYLVTISNNDTRKARAEKFALAAAAETLRHDPLLIEEMQNLS